MSQFSYELDERQIRIMLQNAELDCSETAWQQFDALVKFETARPKAQAPKFNFGLSRQILVPAFFVVVICGLSALLFSFVDFKKKAAPVGAQAEAASMMANEDKREAPAQKNTAAPVETTAKKDTAALVVKETTSTPVETENTQPAATPPVAVSTVIQKSEPKLVVRKEEPLKRKRRRIKSTETFEDLPAINTSMNLSSGNPEPEPEIKLD